MLLLLRAIHMILVVEGGMGDERLLYNPVAIYVYTSVLWMMPSSPDNDSLYCVHPEASKAFGAQ